MRNHKGLFRMHRIWVISVAALFVLAASPSAQAQMRRDMTADLIGAALGGGLAGVAGVLIGTAIEDVVRQPSYRTSQPINVSMAPSYRASQPGRLAVSSGYSDPARGEDGSRLRFDNSPASSTSSSQRLSPRQTAGFDSIIYGLDDAPRSLERPRYLARKFRSPHVRAAHGHHNQRVHARERYAAGGRSR